MNELINAINKVYILQKYRYKTYEEFKKEIMPIDVSKQLYYLIIDNHLIKYYYFLSLNKHYFCSTNINSIRYQIMFNPAVCALIKNNNISYLIIYTINDTIDKQIFRADEFFFPINVNNINRFKEYSSIQRLEAVALILRISLE